MTELEAYLAHLQRFGIKPGLDRIQALLALSGDPHRRYPHVLVGGTNGKGSTCQFLAATLAAEGKRAGLYTSPHIYRWHERVRIITAATLAPGAELFPGAATDAELDDLLAEGRPVIETVKAEFGQPTEFEILTWLALWHFARAAVDIAVVEVGLGGRWDVTNATEPLVSVITHVALDHCDLLGATHELIAADKVQIARPGRILVTAETKPAVLEVFRAHCHTIGARLWPWRLPACSNDKPALAAALQHVPVADYGTVDPVDFQVLNLATARVARLALAEANGEPTEPMPLLQRSLTGSMALEQVPGRVEVLRREPTVLQDGANNPDGAEHLAAFLHQSRKSGAGRLILVLGILADKDYAAMVRVLAPLADVVIATQSSSPRAAPAEAVAAVARDCCADVRVCLTVPAAVDVALGLAGQRDMVCVTGSFYTLSEVDRARVASFTPPVMD